MKTLIRIVVVLLVIILIAVVVSLFLPSKAHVERSAVIKAPAKVVYEQISNVHNWIKWSPWHSIDTTMKINYFGPLEGKDAGYEWQSTNKDVGNGKLTVTSATPYDSIVTEMDFGENGKATAYYILKSTNDGTNIVWGFESDMGMNPIAKFMGLMMDKWIGKDYEKGLKNLSELCKGLPTEVVELKNLKAFNFVGIRSKCKMPLISAEMGKSYGKLMQYLQTEKVQMSGSPFAIYHAYDSTSVEFESGLPVEKELKGKGDIKYGKFEEARVAALDFYGSYAKLNLAYDQLQKWIKDMGMTVSGPPMEQYLTDPMTEKDTTKWLTKVYFPVK